MRSKHNDKVIMNEHEKNDSLHPHYITLSYANLISAAVTYKRLA